MKKELLAATALTASAIVPGLAGAQSPYVDWTGMYFALGAGSAVTNDRFTTNSFGNTTLNRSWHLGTVGAGFNRHSGNLLYGVEADYNFLNAYQRGRTDGGGGAEVATDLQHLLTLRARLGAKSGQTMFFGTGGLAAANASLSTTHTDFGKTSSGSRSETLVGWTGGFGAEYAAADNLFLNLTALYYRLQPLTVNATGITPYTATYTPEGWLLRAGVNLMWR